MTHTLSLSSALDALPFLLYASLFPDYSYGYGQVVPQDRQKVLD
jgi:hypothetical protein